MPTFTLKKVEAVQGRQELEELTIDGVGQLEVFEQELRDKYSRYLTELEMLFAYMQYVANGQSLSETKFRDITPNGESVKEYEFKSKHLRIYAIKKQHGKIIVLGGLKTNQKADFRRFRSLKAQYLNSL